MPKHKQARKYRAKKYLRELTGESQKNSYAVMAANIKTYLPGFSKKAFEKISSDKGLVLELGRYLRPIKKQRRIVYIIGNTEFELAKIGYTKRPIDRFQTLQTGCPFKLDVLAFFDGKGKRLEGKLHRQMKNVHFRAEWFRIAGPLIDLLSEHTTTPMKNFVASLYRVRDPHYFDGEASLSIPEFASAKSNAY